MSSIDKNENSEQVGNAAAMREALEFVAHLDDDSYTSYDIAVAVQKANDALSAPPRQCDVGNAEDQTERFKQLCWKYRRGPGPRANCKGCPVSHESQHVGCTFAWAQMPYSEGDK